MNNQPSWEWIEHTRRDVLTGRPLVEESEAIDKFKQSLIAWSIRNNPNALWCRETAYQTLGWWSVSPSALKAGFWIYVYVGQPIMPFNIDKPNPMDFDFRFFTMYPREGFRQDVRKRILDECAKELDRFLDEREKNAKEGGMIATSRKTAKEHFEWLALKQFKNMTCAEIFALYQEQAKAERRLRRAWRIAAMSYHQAPDSRHWKPDGAQSKITAVVTMTTSRARGGAECRATCERKEVLESSNSCACCDRSKPQGSIPVRE